MSPLDRDHLETTSLAVGIVAAIYGGVKWFFTPLVLLAVRKALAAELERLSHITETLAATAARLDGIERRLELLENRE